MSHRPDYVPDGTTGEGAIAKEGYFEREKKKTDVGKKLHQLIQADEQKKINKHGEGVCYGCMRKDYIISSLFYCCSRCMEKRGTEALYTIVYHKPSEEICDFCGKWQKPFDTYQINASLCTQHCWPKMERFHREYREAGGKSQNPLEKKHRRKYGKDYKILRTSGARPAGI
ncbi:hypothetical protein [Nitrosopumilus sp.]|uniref:hypothetical protein n=1 Tax=Nitrosopumilus sp. TaxID=2024843 RepID=UPI003D12AD7A